MKPSLRQLQYFVSVADTGAFSAAAQACFVSQPSLSTQIADMEAVLGTTLFERGRHGALLTPAGEALAVRARLILRDVEAFRALARQPDDTLSGKLRLGVLPSIGPYLLPHVTRVLHAQFPDLVLAVREERTLDLQDHLSDGRLDFIVSTPDDHPGMRSADLFQENLYICVAPDHPLAKNKTKPIAPKDLAGRALLTLGYGHRLSQITRNLAALSDATVSSEYEGTSLDAIRQMASMGAGVAILPSLYAKIEARRDTTLIIRQITHPLAQRKIHMLWRPTSPLADKFEMLAAVFKEQAAGLLG